MAEHTDERFFEGLCRDAGLAVVATDEQLRIRFSNASAERLLGVPGDVGIGQPVLSFVPESRRALMERLLRRALERGEVREFETRHVLPDGQNLYLAVTVSPIRDPSGRGMGVSLCARDMTRGMDLLRDVAEAQRMSALGVMAGAVAHHFNNLLGGVITTIDFAQASNNPDLLRRALRATGAALMRASGMTRSLLAFAEGDHGDVRTGAAVETVQRFIAENQDAWSQRDIAVEADLDPIEAQVPVRPLINILEVLTSNAREAMIDGGTLRIELKHDTRGGLRLSVSDTGVGISKENLRYAFEPFFTTKRSQEPDLPDHVGLGLPVVHGLVKDLGGRVTLESQEEKGTNCTVFLPFVS